MPESVLTQEPSAQSLRLEIQHRLEGWGSRYGWGPKDETTCNRSLWEESTQIEYKLFLAYRKIAQDLGIKVNGAVIERDRRYLYFAHCEGNRNVWKIGVSSHPYQRGAQLQTGNHTTIIVEFCTPCTWPDRDARTLEQVVLLFTENRQIKARSKEWRDLNQSYVEHLIKILVADADDVLKDVTALTRRYDRPPKKGPCPLRINPRTQPKCG